jgi:hypothetical protein
MYARPVGELDTMYADFEALGEDEVAFRMDHMLYHGPTRAYAMRWLNEKAMQRQRSNSTRKSAQRDSDAAVVQRAERATRLALAAASLAVLFGAMSAGLAYMALKKADAAYNQALGLATPRATPGPAARPTAVERRKSGKAAG